MVPLPGQACVLGDSFCTAWEYLGAGGWEPDDVQLVNGTTAWPIATRSGADGLPTRTSGGIFVQRA